jgi:hypothetical protein
MKFVSFIFAAIVAASAVEASTLRASSAVDVTNPIDNAGEHASDAEGGDRELADFYAGYDYKKLYVFWTGKGTRCWDAASFDNSGDPIPYARECKYEDGQYWSYTKDGQIYNKKYQKCVSYDYNKKQGHYFFDSAGNDYPVYIYLEDCGDYSWQRWVYVDKHWVSSYDGTCIDLVRDHGGYFAPEQCKKCWKDHLHTVEDYWFYDWDDNYCA